eukprot:CAMPEP_0194137922 /NCGR_PEP_ID=MMETSP0152-20130528/7755_1 /TAXON_ID=1049557 /ORGANISM="Thalassiothrix antarctica, Strain L6-D1" /LENGTH=610 /DNA_ID=CAMNT_0038835135 /DNA_START=46 /DNA_END=1878 /DNA_ORIENTATION=-
MSSPKDEIDLVDEDDDDSDDSDDDSDDNESEEGDSEDDESEDEDNESEDDESENGVGDDDDESDDGVDEEEGDDDEEDGDEEDGDEEDDDEEDDDEEDKEGDAEEEDDVSVVKLQENGKSSSKEGEVEENPIKAEATAESETEDKNGNPPKGKEKATPMKEGSLVEDKKEEITAKNIDSQVDEEKILSNSIKNVVETMNEGKNTELKDEEKCSGAALDSQLRSMTRNAKKDTEEKECPNIIETISKSEDVKKYSETENGKENSAEDKLKPVPESTEGKEIENIKSESEDENKEESMLENVRSVFRNSKADGSSKSFWQLTKESFQWGNDVKKDAIVFSAEECVMSLKAMLSEVENSDPKWQFTLTPLEPLNATLDDLLRAFAMWSRKEGENDMLPSFNATKAFARLGAYASWMEEHRICLEKPLTTGSIGETAHLWQMKLTHCEKEGKLVCWLDVGSLNLMAIKKSGHDASGETLRYIVWLCHVAMFDQKGQEKGMIIVESIGNTGTMKSLTIIPRDLSNKLDHLTIGVLPVRLNAFYIMKYKRWLSVMVGLMKPFLSQKMRQRIVLIPLRTNTQKFLDDLVGKNAIPSGFGGLEGMAEDDLIFGKYLIE